MHIIAMLRFDAYDSVDAVSISLLLSRCAVAPD